MGPKESQRINTSQSSAVFDVSLRGSEGSGAAASGERCGHLREPGERPATEKPSHLGATDPVALSKAAKTTVRPSDVAGGAQISKAPEPSAEVTLADLQTTSSVG